MTSFVLREIAYIHDAEAGASSESWVLEPETFGPPGETILIPTARVADPAYVGLPPHRSIRWTQYDPRKQVRITPRSAIARGIGVKAYFIDGDASGVWCCRRFFCDSSADWVNVVPAASLIGTSPQPKMLVLDPLRQSYGAYVVVYDASTGLFSLQYIANLSSSPTVFHLFDAPAHYQLSVSPSRVLPGVVWAIANNIQAFVYTQQPVYLYRRTSPTGAFVQSTIDSKIPRNSATLTIYSGSTKSSYESSVINVTYPSSLGDPDTTWARSTDGGDTFSPVWTHATYLLPLYGMPFDNDADDDVVFALLDVGVVRRDPDGTLTTIAAGHAPSQAQLHFCQTDRDVIFMAARPGYTAVYLQRTIDGGLNWSNLTLPLGGTTAEITWIAGWPSDPEYLVIHIYGGGNAGVWWTANAVSGGTSPTWTRANPPGTLNDTYNTNWQFPLWETGYA